MNCGLTSLKNLISSPSDLKLALATIFRTACMDLRMTLMACSHCRIGLSISKSMKFNCSLRLCNRGAYLGCKGNGIYDRRYTIYDIRSRSFGTMYDMTIWFTIFLRWGHGVWFTIYDIRCTMFDLRPRSFGTIYDLRCLLSGLYFIIFSLRYLLIAHATDYLL